MTQDPASARHIAINIYSKGTSGEQASPAPGSRAHPGRTPTRVRQHEPVLSTGRFSETAVLAPSSFNYCCTGRKYHSHESRDSCCSTTYIKITQIGNSTMTIPEPLLWGYFLLILFPYFFPQFTRSTLSLPKGSSPDISSPWTLHAEANKGVSSLVRGPSLLSTTAIQLYIMTICKGFVQKYLFETFSKGQTPVTISSKLSLPPLVL